MDLHFFSFLIPCQCLRVRAQNATASNQREDGIHGLGVTGEFTRIAVRIGRDVNGAGLRANLGLREWTHLLQLRRSRTNSHIDDLIRVGVGITVELLSTHRKA